MATYLFDLDGTLLDWDTNDWMPGAIEMLQTLYQHGHEICFITRRGHDSLNWTQFSIENTTPLLEKLGIPYRIWYGVISPRILIDDSACYALRVQEGEGKNWKGAAGSLEVLARALEQGEKPDGIIDKHNKGDQE